MFSLTTPQKNIWNLQKFYSDSSISNISGIFVFNEKRNFELLRKAINVFVKKQEGIRLRFIEKGKDIYQYVAAYEYIDIPIIHFSNMEEVRVYFKKDEFKVFSMTDHAMYRFHLFDASNQCGIYFCFSHLISDAWTLSLFCHKVVEYYHLLEQGLKIDETIASYMNYIQREEEYKQSERYRKDIIYWNNRFSSKPIVSYIKPNCIKSKSIKSERLTKNVNFDMTRRIQKWCEKNNVSLAVIFEAVVFAYLYKINENSKEIVIGIPVLNRTTRFDKEIAGMFVSTMPLGVTVSGEETIFQLCNKISDSHRKIFRHQKYPYSYILENIRNKFDFFENLFDVMVSYQNAQIECDNSFKYHTEWFHNGYSEISLALHIDDRDKSGSLTINMDYQTDIFSNTEAEFLYERFYFILRQFVENNSIIVSELSMIPENEYQKIIFGFNDTSIEYPRQKCIHELFMERAALCSDKIALIFEKKQFTYKQIDEMSNSLAYYLRNIGVKPNDIIPIIMKRSWHMIVAMLGVLKAGGAYMPVDISYPQERIIYMIEEAHADICLIYNYTYKLNITSIDLENFNFYSNVKSISNVNRAEDLCYVLFTSGSTGKPKAVMILHYNLCNFIDNNDNNLYQSNMLNDCVTVLAITTFVFDISIFEIYLPLINGLKVVLTNEAENSSALLLAYLIEKYNVDVIHTTPTRLLTFFKNREFQKASKNLKILMIGAEVFTPELYYTISKYTNAIVYNGYGPTETTIGVSFKCINEIKYNCHKIFTKKVCLHSDKTDCVSGNKCKQEGLFSDKIIENLDITIGKPIANTQIYILDENRKPLPIGIAGELCISGDGVGGGYFNHPDLSAEKFIPNPFSKDKMMYCSGDLARWRTDGEIEYLGRMDTQIKIRGLRVELSEIESVMNTFNGINMAAVIDKRNENNHQYIVGYYTSYYKIDEKELRHYLSEKLPNYMVPNYFMKLEEIPMTIGGKIDRKNLPMPYITINEMEYIKPRSYKERILCDIVAEILNYKKVGINDNFFELGGDSLKAIEYTAEAFEKGIVFDSQTVFEYPTVEELSQYLVKKEKLKIFPRYFREDFERYKEVLCKNQFHNCFQPNMISLGNIFLTGATGYLGAHILDNLMKHETGKVYCLVRSSSLKDGYKRLQQILNYYFGERYKKEIGERIIPIVGDIVNENISDHLPNDIQTIIHAAATVKHFGDYSYFDIINRNGTKHMLQFAKKKGAKFIFISTISVGGLYLIRKGKEKIIFKESDLYIEQNLNNVYLRSKFEAERLVLDAKLSGYNCIIFRVGNLTNRYTDGLFQPNYQENAFLHRMKTWIDLKAYPTIISMDLIEFSPVDYTAEAIVKLIQYSNNRYSVFHINNPKRISCKELAVMLYHSRYYTLEILEIKQFLQRIRTHMNHVYDSVKNELNERKIMEEYIKVIPDSSFTEQFFKKIGFEWCEITQEYIDRYIQYFGELNYWN